VVQEVAPHIPVEVIRADLLITRSAPRTIDNILEGRIVVPDDVPHVDHHPAPAANPPAVNNPPNLDSLSTVNINSEIENAVSSIPAGFASTPAEREKNLRARKLALQQQSKL
jgi:hypothetical protein